MSDIAVPHVTWTEDLIALAAGLLVFALYGPPALTQKLAPSIGEANNFRVIFFVLTFFSIGLLSNFKKLWQEGFAKLVAVYAVSLFGFVIWVGLVLLVILGLISRVG